MNPENFERSSDGSVAAWWFNTKTGLVEFGLVSAAPYRIGPFKTEDEAKQALDIVRARAKSWATEEEADS